MTLAETSCSVAQALEWMDRDERFMLGERQGQDARRLPITLDTADSDEDKCCWEQMQAHPGIDFVDVVCVFLS